MNQKQLDKMFESFNTILSQNREENEKAYKRLRPIVKKKEQEFLAKITAVVEVKFEGNPKPYYFNNKFTSVRPGQRVLVDTKFGPKIAIVTGFRKKDQFQPGHPTKDVIKKIKRKA